MITKRTEQMLDRRGLNINRYRRQVVTTKSYCCGAWESFTKADLEDTGRYEITEEDDHFGGTSANMYHITTALESDEQFARRVCKEFDQRKNK